MDKRKGLLDLRYLINIYILHGFEVQEILNTEYRGSYIIFLADYHGRVVKFYWSPETGLVQHLARFHSIADHLSRIWESDAKCPFCGEEMHE